MPTTMPMDAPTWLIVLEYLKVIFSPGFLITIAGLVWLFMYLWTYYIHPIGVRCDAKYSELIDKTAILYAETAGRIEKGDFPEHLMKDCIKDAAQTFAMFQRAKDIGNTNILKEVFHDLVRRVSGTGKTKKTPIKNTDIQQKQD